MLRVEGLSAGYGGLPVINDVSITVGAGQFVSIVGPNGAGKTTLFKTISGILTPKAGAHPLRGRRPRHRAGRAPAASRHRPCAGRAARCSRR